MLVPMQAFMDPMQLRQLRLQPEPEPVLEPGPMPQPKLEPQPELELKLGLVPMPQPELVLMPEQLLELELIHRLEPELAPTNQLAGLMPQPKLELERQREPMDQQLLMEFLIVKPEQQLVHLELQPIMALHRHKAFDWSTTKRVVLGSIPGCMPRHRDKRFH